MKQINLILLFLSLSFNISGQLQKNIDSLINVLNNENLSNKEQILIYRRICINFGHSDFKQLLKYCNKGLMLAKKEDDAYNTSIFYEMLGFYYESSFKYDSARIYYNEALNVALKNNDTVRESQVYLSLGAMSFMQEQYTSALDYFMEAEKISVNLKNQATHVYVLGNIGMIHHKMKNNDIAIPFFEQALKVAMDIPKYPKLKIIPMYYLGLIYREKEEFDRALEYTQNALNISKSIKEKTDESAALQSIANIYLLKTPPDYKKALKYADSSLYIAKEAGYPSMIAGALSVKSNIYKAQKQWKLCEETAYKAYEIDSLNTGNDIFPNIFKNITLANIYLGNKEKADLFFNKFSDYMLKSSDKNLHSSISDMQTKYETEKKEIQIASLEKEKQFYTWFGVAGILFAFTLGIVLWQNIRNIKKEKQLIASQSVMDGEMSERTRLARDLHDRLSGNLSAVKIELSNTESPLNISNKLDNCIEEVRRVAHNLMPASLQYGIKIALEDFVTQFPNVHFYFFGKDSRFEERVEFVIYCCANELVNNSLKHSGSENINLQLVQNDKYITLTVQDDGRGYDEKAVKKGLGLKNIYDRVISYNGKIDIVSVPNRGTETIIELKIK